MKASRLHQAGLAVALWLGGRWLARWLRSRPAGQRRADVRNPAAVHDMLLHVLGHDLRAPNASLLAWLELRRTQDQADAALLAQVGGHARPGWRDCC